MRQARPNTPSVIALDRSNCEEVPTPVQLTRQKELGEVLLMQILEEKRELIDPESFNGRSARIILAIDPAGKRHSPLLNTSQELQNVVVPLDADPMETSERGGSDRIERAFHSISSLLRGAPRICNRTFGD